MDSAGKIVSERAFTKSCITMAPQALANTTPAALIITHLLDPTPTEIHVYLSLLSRLPVYVGTTDARVWLVNGAAVFLATADVRKH